MISCLRRAYREFSNTVFVGNNCNGDSIGPRKLDLLTDRRKFAKANHMAMNHQRLPGNRHRNHLQQFYRRLVDKGNAIDDKRVLVAVTGHYACLLNRFDTGDSGAGITLFIRAYRPRVSHDPPTGKCHSATHPRVFVFIHKKNSRREIRLPASQKLFADGIDIFDLEAQRQLIAINENFRRVHHLSQAISGFDLHAPHPRRLLWFEANHRTPLMVGDRRTGE
ncbi:hypothetical protein D3C84_342050 [compost metagenome]